MLVKSNFKISRSATACFIQCRREVLKASLSTGKPQGLCKKKMETESFMAEHETTYNVVVLRHFLESVIL